VAAPAIPRLPACGAMTSASGVGLRVSRQVVAGGISERNVMRSQFQEGDLHASDSLGRGDRRACSGGSIAPGDRDGRELGHLRRADAEGAAVDEREAARCGAPSPRSPVAVCLARYEKPWALLGALARAQYRIRQPGAPPPAAAKATLVERRERAWRLQEPSMSGVRLHLEVSRTRTRPRMGPASPTRGRIPAGGDRLA